MEQLAKKEATGRKGGTDSTKRAAEGPRVWKRQIVIVSYDLLCDYVCASLKRSREVLSMKSQIVTIHCLAQPDSLQPPLTTQYPFASMLFAKARLALPPLIKAVHDSFGLICLPRTTKSREKERESEEFSEI